MEDVPWFQVEETSCRISSCQCYNLDPCIGDPIEGILPLRQWCGLCSQMTIRATPAVA